MTFVAGVDIGNATTEIVIVDSRTSRPVAWERSRTRGLKGSAEASRSAGRLLTRMQASLGSPVDCAIGTHQVPVATRRLDLPSIPVATGRLRIVASPSATPGGTGFGVGRPLDLADPGASPHGAGPVIAVSRDPLGYLQTVATVRGWLDSGCDIRGVLLAGDEAVLVARRLGHVLPIVDGVDAQAALSASLVAVEVADAGRTCRQVADPLRLVASLNLGVEEHAHASAIAASVTGLRSTAVALMPEATSAADSGPLVHVRFSDGSSVSVREAAAAIEAANREVAGLIDTDGILTAASDLWLVDPQVLSAIPGLRQPQLSRVALSTLANLGWLDDHLDGLREAWSGEVRIVGSESSAALRGALSTPGVSPEALVVDLGGGTIDLVHPNGRWWTGAGSGELMTLATSIATGSSRAAAEWIKRSPAWRIETPHLAIDESGDRRFLDAPASQGSVGALVTSGPSGELPFARELTLGEWRSMRLALKEEVFGRNARRGLRHVPDLASPDIVLVGGPAGDDEIVEAMHASLGRVRDGISIGRADVGGVLGHRWAVAYGLVLLALDEVR